MRNRFRVATFLEGRTLALLLLFLRIAPAQSNLATVTGMVTDPSLAILPGVTIVIRNVETTIARTVVTDQAGDFTVTNLHPGSYELTAEVSGFRSYRRTGIVLEVGQVLRIDITMTLGAPIDSVTVTAGVVAINTESGAIKGDVIVQGEIQALPLDGRDFTDLAFLVPGVVPLAQGGQGSAMAINGARSDSTNFIVDGFNNRNPRGAAAQVRPNMGALQEFKMETSGYSAEYGRMAGGILNMALRSGTNEFHGELIEYLRNDIFDARAFFDTEKLTLRRNQFGATVGGPLLIPKIYDGHGRTFFLFSWEGFREILGQSRLGHTPTAEERRGDFAKSQTYLGEPLFLRDPFTTGACSVSDRSACFPDNVIPASRFDPIGQRVLDFYPLPNRADPRNNYIVSARDVDSWDSFVGKVDHRFSTKDSIALRYQKRFLRASAPFAGSNLGIFGNSQRDDRSLLGLDLTHIFSPSFLAEVRGGFSRNATREYEIWTGRNIAAEFGIPGTTTDPMLIGFPRFTVLGHFDVGAAANQPVQYHVTTIQGSGKLTWVRSKHILKWGVDAERVRFNQPFFNNNRGTFNFQDRWTNHPIGDLLLGLLNNTSRTVGTTRNYLRSTSYGLFINDDYKISRSLTLNLGLRYELDQPPVDRYDRMSNFIPSLNKIIIASDATIPNLAEEVARANLTERVGLARDFNLPRSLVFADYTNFAPRLGFAWRVLGSQKTVLRGGWGIFYTGHLLNPIRTSLMTGFPFSANETYSRLATEPALLTLANPFPEQRRAEGGVTTSNGYDLHAPTGYVQSFNLTVERDLGEGAAIEIGYVGSRGAHLGRQYDMNQPLRTRELYQAGATFPRPVSGLNAINFYSFGSNSIYHAGQISLRKRGSGGLFYRLNYSFSKSIDDASQISGNSDGGVAGAQNARDLKSERARSDFDRRHIFTAAFSWQLPLGRGQRWLNSSGALTQAVLGGWQFSGTGTLYSGQPFTVTTADVDANLGESQRPNRLGTGLQSDLTGQGRRGVDYPFFNILDFERVPRCTARDACLPSPHGFEPFQFANAGRNILEGPGMVFLNLALMKNFRMRERRNFQFRCEMFNVMNRPNFLLPNRQFNTVTGALLNSVTDRGRGGPRVVQLALKFDF
jgi:hypothetical protein